MAPLPMRITCFSCSSVRLLWKVASQKLRGAFTPSGATPPLAVGTVTSPAHRVEGLRRAGRGLLRFAPAALARCHGAQHEQAGGARSAARRSEHALEHFGATLDQAPLGRSGQSANAPKTKAFSGRLALRSRIFLNEDAAANMRPFFLARCSSLVLAFAPMLGCNKTPPEAGAGDQKQSSAPATLASAPAPEAAKSAEPPPAEPPPTPEQPNAIPAPADVAQAPADAKTTASGLKIKVLKAGAGKEHPKDGDRVSVHYSGWTKDGKMFDSSVARGAPTTFGVNEVIPGWTEALKLMLLGEKSRLWIPGKLAYGDRPQMGGAPTGDLTFDVELLEIVKPPATPEDVKAPPATAKKTASGLAYRVLKPGTGKIHPTANNRVTVHYSGWSTDGKMFDSSVARGEPATFSLGGVIKGWTEGVQLMVVGEKDALLDPGLTRLR